MAISVRRRFLGLAAAFAAMPQVCHAAIEASDLRLRPLAEPTLEMPGGAGGSWLPAALGLLATAGALLAVGLVRRRRGALAEASTRCRRLAEPAGDDLPRFGLPGSGPNVDPEDLVPPDDPAPDVASSVKPDVLASVSHLASMSHEIRTPLTAILGFAELALAEPGLPPAARRHVERIRGGGDALLSIVGDILDVAQAEAGTLRLDPQPLALRPLIEECIALVQPAIRAKRLAVRVVLADGLPPGVLGDAVRLRQILLNLLNNAVKFTHEGAITLCVAYRPGEARFEVTDTGIGIDAADLPRLFRPFSQVDGTIHRAFGGTGLGLAISKTLVERMGGTMGVESRRGIGSTFWFALDLPPAALPGTAAAPPPGRQARRPLDVLLVEDTALNQELARAVVEADGHRVDVVGDGAEAIMAVADKVYDLVLMDVQMPHVDGLTATRAIRELPLPQRFVPIVAMTANVLRAQLDAALAAGMEDVLAKPLDFEAVRAILARAERGALRPSSADPIIDAEVLAKLVGIVGAPKVETMLATLVRSLAARFTRPLDEGTLAALKGEAHASIAGSAMMGFKGFAAICRRVADGSDRTQLASDYAELKDALAAVVATAARAGADLSPYLPRRAA